MLTKLFLNGIISEKYAPIVRSNRALIYLKIYLLFFCFINILRKTDENVRLLK